MNTQDADIILTVRDDGQHANVVVNAERARMLSPEADAFFTQLSHRGLGPFLALMQDDDGAFGFVDVDEVIDAGEEPALLEYPLETSRFLTWFARKWNVQRPIQVLHARVVADESPQRGERAGREPRGREPRNRRLREVPGRYSRRGRR